MWTILKKRKKLSKMILKYIWIKEAKNHSSCIQNFYPKISQEQQIIMFNEQPVYHMTSRLRITAIPASHFIIRFHAKT